MPRPCTQRHQWNYHLYMTLPRDFEYTVEVPGTTGNGSLTIRIAKVGGGTPGNAYEGHWYYSVTGIRALGIEHAHGDDLYTGSPHTHAQAAGALARVLAGGYPEGTAAHDTLALFASKAEG